MYLTWFSFIINKTIGQTLKLNSFLKRIFLAEASINFLTFSYGKAIFLRLVLHTFKFIEKEFPFWTQMNPLEFPGGNPIQQGERRLSRFSNL